MRNFLVIIAGSWLLIACQPEEQNSRGSGDNPDADATKSGSEVDGSTPQGETTTTGDPGSTAASDKKLHGGRVNLGINQIDGFAPKSAYAIHSAASNSISLIITEVKVEGSAFKPVENYECKPCPNSKCASSLNVETIKVITITLGNKLPLAERYQFDSKDLNQEFALLGAKPMDGEMVVAKSPQKLCQEWQAKIDLEVDSKRIAGEVEAFLYKSPTMSPSVPKCEENYYPAPVYAAEFDCSADPGAGSKTTNSTVAGGVVKENLKDPDPSAVPTGDPREEVPPEDPNPDDLISPNDLPRDGQFIFVTSTTLNGSMEYKGETGPAAADKLCADSAAGSRLNFAGKFVALLPHGMYVPAIGIYSHCFYYNDGRNSDCHPRLRYDFSNNRIYNTNGELIGRGNNQFWQETHLAPMKYDENGRNLGDFRLYYTGFNGSGYVEQGPQKMVAPGIFSPSNFMCGPNWNTSTIHQAQLGRTGAMDRDWFHNTRRDNCSVAVGHVLCMQVF